MNVQKPAGIYAIYLRKSREEDEQDRYTGEDTLARHRKTLIELASRQGLAIGEIYEEVVSGDTIISRPEMQRLLSDVRGGRWAGVLVTETPRLARGDTIDQGIVSSTFKYSKCQIITPSKTYDPSQQMDEQQLDMQLFFSRWELTSITTRMQAGRLRSAQDGRYMGSRDVYGYKRVKLEGQKGYSLEVRPDQADIIRQIFSWYVHGDNGTIVGCSEIARRLNALGLPTTYGKKWNDGTIRRLLRNEVYLGKVKWQQRIQEKYMDGSQVKKRRVRNEKESSYNGLHEPIIDRETYDKAGVLMATNNHAPINVAREMINPLSGLIKCGICGKSLHRGANVTNDNYSIIGCVPDCPTRSVYIKICEGAILKALSDYANTEPEIEEPIQDENDSDTNTIAIAEREIERLNAQISRVCELYETGEYTKDLFKRRQQEISDGIAKAKAAIEEVKSKPERVQSDDEIFRAIAPKIRTVLEAYAAATTPAEKNALLKSVISSVTYYKTQRRYKGDPPGTNLKLEIHPVRH